MELQAGGIRKFYISYFHLEQFMAPSPPFSTANEKCEM
jgi:hypothetical protein